jgi:hypothetical protein
MGSTQRGVRLGVKLIDNTAKIKQQIHIQLAQGINNACAFWVNEAIDLAPEDTGFLKAHIGQTVTATPNSLHGELRSLAPYSQAVNGGTSRQAPQPFWTVAGLLTRQKFDWLLKSGFIAIRRVGSAGGGIIRQALEDFHGPTGRGGQGF